MAFVKPLVSFAQTKGGGLTENETKWISHLQKSEESFHDILSTAALRRQHYGHMVGILCRSREDAISVNCSERTLYVEGYVADTQAGSESRLLFVFITYELFWKHAPMHIHTRTQASAHTHSTHTYTYAYKHTHTHTHTRARAHARTHTHTHVRAYNNSYGCYFRNSTKY